MHDRQDDEGVPDTTALVLGAVIMSPIAVVAVIVVFVPQSEDRVLGIQRRGDLCRLSDDTRHTHQIRMNARDLDEPVVKAIRVRAGRVY